MSKYHELTEKLVLEDWASKDVIDNIIREWLEEKAQRLQPNPIMGERDTTQVILGLTKDPVEELAEVLHYANAGSIIKIGQPYSSKIPCEFSMDWSKVAKAAIRWMEKNK